MLRQIAPLEWRGQAAGCNLIKSLSDDTERPHIILDVVQYVARWKLATRAISRTQLSNLTIQTVFDNRRTSELQRS